MTAHVTQAKIEAAVRAAVAAGWTGGVEIDLKAGVVRLLPVPQDVSRRDTGPDPDAVRW